MIYVDDYNRPFKLICQDFNGYVWFYGTNGELLYTTFLYTYMAPIGLYPEDLEFNTCIRMILKEVNVDHNLLRCPDL